MPGLIEVLALDVSSSAAGYAFFLPDGRADFGVIRPRVKDAAIARIDHIVLGVERLLRRITPKLVVMEWSSGKVHGRIAKASGLSVLGAAQGAVRQAIVGIGFTVETVEENEWTGSRSKISRASTMMMIHPGYGAWAREGNDPGMDAADALGILEWYRERSLTAELLARAR